MMKVESRLGILSAAQPVATADFSAHQRVRAVVDAEHAFVWRTLRRLGVRAADIDDAVQEVFVTFFRRAADVEEGKERAFLFRTCEFLALRARRTLARRRELSESDPAANEVLTQRATEHEMGRTEALDTLDRLLDLLDDDLRSIFVLYEIEEMTRNEIALLLDLPNGTVATRLRRARKIFLAHARSEEVSDD